MPGTSGKPYNKNQEPSFCGCYYPDVTRRSDDAKKMVRTWFCINHGEFTSRLKKGVEPIKEVLEIPSEEWRKAERKRISSINT
jgi:hypothetical protein